MVYNSKEHISRVRCEETVADKMTPTNRNFSFTTHCHHYCPCKLIYRERKTQTRLWKVHKLYYLIKLFFNRCSLRKDWNSTTDSKISVLKWLLATHKECYKYSCLSNCRCIVFYSHQSTEISNHQSRQEIKSLFRVIMPLFISDFTYKTQSLSYYYEISLMDDW